MPILEAWKTAKRMSGWAVVHWVAETQEDLVTHLSKSQAKAVASALNSLLLRP